MARAFAYSHMAGALPKALDPQARALSCALSQVGEQVHSVKFPGPQFPHL